MKVLNRHEELALLAVWRLQPDAYGVSIRKYISDITDATWSVGAIYDSLERLALRGHLISSQADPTPRRGGRSKRYYRLTKAGYQALVRMKSVHESLWQNLPDLGFPTPLEGAE